MKNFFCLVPGANKVAMQHRLIGCTFVLMAALLSANISGAAPYFRDTSLMNIPTAYVSQEGFFDVGVHTAILNRNRDELAIRVDFGVFNFAELGMVGLKRDGSDYVIGSLKLLAAQESGTTPSLAIGIDNFGEEVQDDSGNYELSFYGVVSKQFNLPVVHLISGHLGIGNHRYVSDTSIGEYLHGVFIGIDKRFHLSSLDSDLRLMLEVDGKDLNIGLRYVMGSGLSANLAVGELDSDPGDVRYYLGISFTNASMMDRINQSSELAKKAVKIANEVRSGSEKGTRGQGDKGTRR